MLETEIKSIIAEEVYQKVKNAFDWDSSVLQTNHYYTDRGGVLASDRITVRIREKNGKNKLQIKSKKRGSGALQICEETEYEMQDIPDVIPKDFAKRVTETECGELYKLGTCQTLRHSLMWDQDTEICLDKSEYFGVTDYEVEVEYTKGVSETLKEKLFEFGVSFDKKAKGKFSRFMKKYKEVNGV